MTEAIDYFRYVDDFFYEPKKDSLTEELISEFISSLLSDFLKKGKENIKFDDQYIVGKLINVLSSYDESLKVIDFLNEELTGYPTSVFFLAVNAIMS